MIMFCKIFKSGIRHNYRYFNSQQIKLRLIVNNCYIHGIVVGINYCLSSPCQNGATCSSLAGQYSCNCPSGFTGLNCASGLVYKYV